MTAPSLSLIQALSGHCAGKEGKEEENSVLQLQRRGCAGSQTLSFLIATTKYLQLWQALLQSFCLAVFEAPYLPARLFK